MKRRRRAKKRRAKNVITYHGRRGHPVLHTSSTGRKYIMVRKRGGGVKRLYEGTKYKENGQTRTLRLK